MAPSHHLLPVVHRLPRGRRRRRLFFYARYRYDEIPKIHSKHLVKQAATPGKPFNVLLVGRDSRAFVSNPTQVKAFGDEADAGGQRSDVTMVARFVPATKSVTVISIPRDLWVDIPQNSTYISGMNRINAAYNSGPDLLIQTIESVLHIPINHYISVGFEASRAWSTPSAASPWTFPRRSRMPTPGST